MDILRYYTQVGIDLCASAINLLRVHKLTLVEVRTEGENIRTFILKPHKKVDFVAGQYGAWFIPRFVWGKPVRLFTIAASPTEDTLQISTRISSSDFKKKLAVLPIGTHLYMCGPIGRFTLGSQPPATAVLIAGGIGVTPMRALSRFVYDAKLATSLHLVHSANGYYLYRKEFEQMVPDCHFATKDTFLSELDTVCAAVTPDTVFYISGPPAFVTFAEAELHKRSIRRIKKDGFLGY